MLRNDAPCFTPDGFEPYLVEETLQTTLEKICPKFAAAHASVCCDAAQMSDLDAKFTSMFEPANAGSLFDGCPSCVRSQLEYYCNMYCSPRQSGTVCATIA